MNSKGLKSYGFGKWHEFSKKNGAKLLESLPRQKSVYAIKYETAFGRFKGKSDLMYFGSSADKIRGLRGRIRSYFKPGKTQKTSRRINKLLKKMTGLKISFVTVSNAKNPRKLEKKTAERI